MWYVDNERRMVGISIAFLLVVGGSRIADRWALTRRYTLFRESSN